MNKCSAVFMAAGLVAVLTLGGIAFHSVSRDRPRARHPRTPARPHTPSRSCGRKPRRSSSTDRRPRLRHARCSGPLRPRSRHLPRWRRAATRPTTTKARWKARAAVVMTDQERPEETTVVKAGGSYHRMGRGRDGLHLGARALEAAPKPAVADQAAPAAPQKVIVRRVVKKVVIVGQAKPAPVHVVYTGGGGSTNSAPRRPPSPREVRSHDPARQPHLQGYGNSDYDRPPWLVPQSEPLQPRSIGSQTSSPRRSSASRGSAAKANSHR